MYESPILVNLMEGYEKFKREMDEMIGDEVYQQVLQMGIQVDKEEMEKALLYDRHQYMKGYNAGYAAAEEKFRRALDTIRETVEGI